MFAYREGYRSFALLLIAFVLVGCPETSDPSDARWEQEIQDLSGGAPETKEVRTVDTVEDATDLGTELPTVDVQPEVSPEEVLEETKEPEVCTADCTGVECGDDGCGGSCGECDGSGPCATICSDGLCVLPELGEEVCGNGVDEDCDGSDDYCIEPAGMVHSTDFFIDKFEASNCDGSACSQSGTQPWVELSLDNAEAACAARGARLCKAEEWVTACAGNDANSYPYGPDFVAGSCNVENSAMDECGAFASCETPDGIADLVGNVAEWVVLEEGKAGQAGGYYSSLDLATCDTIAPAFGGGVAAHVGFRCCQRWDDDIDDDTAISSMDCDDGDPAVSPGAEEVCDGTDNNCDGEIDETDSCDDGDMCNGVEACEDGACAAADAPNCDDENPCTVDTCEPLDGCINTTAPDNSPCAEEAQWQCLAGLCECVPQCEGIECGDDSCGGDCGTCEPPMQCKEGVCETCGGENAECEAGETEPAVCGKCGTKTRTCNDQCEWDGYGPCENEKSCMVGSKEQALCGNCGTYSRTCTDQCIWGEYGSCTGQGVCSPGQTTSASCGCCSSKSGTCTAQCQWGNWSSCSGGGACCGGEGQWQSCGECGKKYRWCAGGCQWGAWGSCQEGDC
jgi:hypothetical protein